MLCKHHFSKNGQVFFHIFWVVTLIMQSRKQPPHFRKVSIREVNDVPRGQVVFLHTCDIRIK
ncbi:hypothetical protein GFB64_08370 [Lacticaseibacillus paracasei]|nr:hypothetical protein GFB64_08370 [Lacticaseibacillus paracasei]